MALTQVQAELIATNAISGTIIADNAITGVHIAQNAILTQHIDDGQVGTSQLANDAVTNAIIANDAIATAHIQDDQVTSDKLANNIQIAGTLGVTGIISPTTHIDMPDNARIRLGAAPDLQIFHNGTDSYVQDTGTGSLLLAGSAVFITNHDASENLIRGVADGAVTLYHDNSAKLDTASGGVSITGQLELSSHLDMPDAAYIKIGTGDDLELFHTGSNSVVHNKTGQLRVRADSLAIQSYANEDNYIVATADSAVTLYYDNAAKLATASGGVSVTGYLTASGHVSTGADTGYLRAGAANDILIYHDGNHSYLKNDTGNFTIDATANITLDADSGVIDFNDGGTNIGRFENASSDFKMESRVQDKDIVLVGNDGGTGVEALRLDMSAAGTAIFNNDIKIADSKYIRVGDSGDLLIYHDASHSYVEDDGTGDLRLKGSTVRLQGTGGTNLLVGNTGGATTLYHNNSAKLATLSGGVDVTGYLASDALASPDGTQVLYVANTSRVGVGASSPSYKFQVSDTSSSNNKVIASFTGEGVSSGTTTGGQYVAIVRGGAIGQSSNNVAGGLLLGISASPTGSNCGIRGTYEYTNGRDLQFFTSSDNTSAPTNKMIIKGGGNVGIARTSPATSLEVGGTGIQINDGTAGTSPKLVFGTEASTNAAAKCIFMQSYWMKIQGHRNEGVIMHGVNASGTVQEFLKLTGDNNSDASEAHFYSGGGGKVGINTGSPASPLHIEQAGVATNTTNLDNGTALGLQVTIPNDNISSYDGVAIGLGMNGRARSYFAHTHVGTNRDAADLSIYTETGGVIGKRFTIYHDGRFMFGHGDQAGTAASPLLQINDNDTGIFDGGTNIIGFSTAGNERMQINGDGEVKVGTSNDYSARLLAHETRADHHALNCEANTGSYTSSVLSIACTRNSANATYNMMNVQRRGYVTVMQMYDSGNIVNANNSYGSTSDQRLKTNIADASSQWNDIKALKVRKFKMAVGGDTNYKIGVVAQELEASGMSGLVSESPADEYQVAHDSSLEGKKVKEVKYSVLYMKAIKALQEAMTRIETLEAKVKTLEG